MERNQPSRESREVWWAASSRSVWSGSVLLTRNPHHLRTVIQIPGSNHPPPDAQLLSEHMLKALNQPILQLIHSQHIPMANLCLPHLPSDRIHLCQRTIHDPLHIIYALCTQDTSARTARTAERGSREKANENTLSKRRRKRRFWIVEEENYRQISHDNITFHHSTYLDLALETVLVLVVPESNRKRQRSGPFNGGWFKLKTKEKEKRLESIHWSTLSNKWSYLSWFYCVVLLSHLTSPVLRSLSRFSSSSLFPAPRLALTFGAGERGLKMEESLLQAPAANSASTGCTKIPSSSTPFPAP